MEAVRRVVCVLDVDRQAVTGLRVDDGAGNAVWKGGLIDVGGHQLVGLWQEVLRVEVLAVDKGGQPPRRDLVGWD